MTALKKDYTQFDEKRLNLLHTKSIDKIRELERKKANIERQIQQEILNKKEIVKAINVNNDFIRWENTDSYNEFKALPTETQEKLRQDAKIDMQKEAD